MLIMLCAYVRYVCAHTAAKFSQMSTSVYQNAKQRDQLNSNTNQRFAVPKCLSIPINKYDTIPCVVSQRVTSRFNHLIVHKQWCLKWHVRYLTPHDKPFYSSLGSIGLNHYTTEPCLIINENIFLWGHRSCFDNLKTPLPCGPGRWINSPLSATYVLKTIIHSLFHSFLLLLLRLWVKYVAQVNELWPLVKVPLVFSSFHYVTLRYRLYLNHCLQFVVAPLALAYGVWSHLAHWENRREIISVDTHYSDSFVSNQSSLWSGVKWYTIAKQTHFYSTCCH